MIHLSRDRNPPKGWFVGPWNSDVPIAIGYASTGVDERHYHSDTYEVYLVAQGRSTVVVEGKEVVLGEGDILVLEPGEVHTFIQSTAHYLHFVIQTPFVKGDKHSSPIPQSPGVR
jgi:mannose-6-phosphate isomerase-like protein (cupin superfamily)